MSQGQISRNKYFLGPRLDHASRENGENKSGNVNFEGRGEAGQLVGAAVSSSEPYALS